MRPDVTRDRSPSARVAAEAPAARVPLHRRFLPIPLPSPRRGGTWLLPGEPEACRRDLRQFAPILAHVLLILAVARVYRLEGRGFQLVLTLAAAVLPLHYLLPFAWKKRALVLASFGGLGLVFGAATATAAVTLGVALIALARLPIAWGARVGLIALAACAMAACRGGLGPVALTGVVWPILASMFMFRMVIYLYELKHADAPEPWLDALAYFFLLPNACFVHFPVVDYRTFRRGEFARDIHDVQRDGLRMLTRGLVQLLLYRVVYHELLIRPEDVRSIPSLGAFLACNYLLYLRVSGQFHAACGMLHLFGYALPETHRNYLLAESFTDYWRRINIYWKDFMVRVVFNPVAFRLRRRGTPVALAAATAAVFVATWALHAYQAFWLRGSWAVSAPDALFWGILGGLVLVNVQLDARRPRKAGGATSKAARAFKTAGTFATIALLWSLWSSPSVGAWLAMLRRAFA